MGREREERKGKTRGDERQGRYGKVREEITQRERDFPITPFILGVFLVYLRFLSLFFHVSMFKDALLCLVKILFPF